MSEIPPRLGLYLSVPFCRAKCSFCNFASGVGTAEAIERYVAALREEICGVKSWAARTGAVVPEQVDTVYFGGGTPSLLEPAQLRAVMDALRGEFVIGNGAEITMEAAPGQIGEPLLAAAMELGINRVSLGVQSFVDREAQAVGRSHSEVSCLEEFARLRRAGVKNLGVDLIAGLPYQTAESWERSLACATEAGLDHVSVYMLEIDEESRLGREVLGGGARLHAPAVGSDELTAELYERACEVLPGAGLEQYEISNFARKGSRSRHNVKYWERAPYLGLGLDAHSMLLGEDERAIRWANPDELGAYTGAACMRKPEWVEDRGAFEETVFLGLRMVDGLAWKQMGKFRLEWVRELREAIVGLTREGLMGWNEERSWLTPRARMIASEVFGELLAGVVA